MRRPLLILLLAITFFQLSAQNTPGEKTWHQQNPNLLNARSLAKSNLSIKQFQLFQFNPEQFSQSLNNLTSTARNGSTTIVLPFPNADGHLSRFQVQLSNTMHPDLAKKFPNIRAYEGVGVDDPTTTIRFEMSQNGITGMIWSAKKGTQVIQAVEDQSDQYIIYYKKAASRDHSRHFNCQTDHVDQLYRVEQLASEARFNDGMLRTYKLAIATTGEYAAIFGGTKAGAMAAITTTINRVNGILKRDVSVELQIVANNDQIVFTNAATDGFTNDNSSAMLIENQAIIDTVIGAANYDIGHVFATGSGGVAYLGSVCINSIKAGGVTGSQSPQGDAFDVDYVAHEMGHQFGANHTQNNDCQRVFATSFEPGSGSTIMSYAGICFPNVQNNSDDYYHAISISQINGFISSAANACAQKTTTNNTPPVVNAGLDYNIPHSTPFELEGSATDAENNTLTYTWEQLNNDAAPMPPLATSTIGPTFRSFPPIDNPVRQFPTKGVNKDHASTTWERLPSVGRVLNFILTARDNALAGGSTGTDNMSVTVSANAGPFQIQAPNGGESYAAGVTQNITWDVANTNVAPINCTNVDILLSLDGGETYPITLASNTPNDGSEGLFLTNSMISSSARIKIKSSNNVFFDVSNADFQITEAVPGFNIMLSPNTQLVCQGGTATLSVTVVGVDGFTGSVNLSATLPGAFPNYSFAQSTVNTGGATSLNISVPSNATPGTYDVTVYGMSGAVESNETVTFTVIQQSLNTPSLITPTDNMEEVATIPTFNWSLVPDANTYKLEIADTNDFSNIIYSESAITETNHTLPINLINGLTYYWRVQASNQCGSSTFSAIRSFVVTNSLCNDFSNTNTFQISSGLPSTIESDVIITESGVIEGIEVSLVIEHSWIGDLTVSIQSPSGQKATILREICGNEDEINLVFSDEGTGSFPCDPPVSQDLFPPLESFDIFTGEQMNGTWKLLVTDGVELDGGELLGWNLKICRAVDATEPLDILISNTTNPLCNGGNSGSIQASVVGGTPNYAINWSNGDNELTINGLTAGTYQVTVTDSEGDTSTATAVLTQPSAIFIDEIIQNNICNDGNAGSIQIFPSGGNANGGYQYQWGNGVQQFNNLNLPQGNYEVTVTDGNGCEKTDNYTVIAPTPIELSFTSTDANDGANGSVNLSVNGGAGGYSYEWSSGAITRDVEGLAPGNFTVTVYDANQCSAEGEVTIIQDTSSQEPCINVTVNITLDNYGEETKWELRDSNDVIVQTGGPFNNFENGSVQAISLCLPLGCYEFTIFDLWGDGMCCAYGQGGYQIIEDTTGKVLASGGSFGKQEKKYFCLPSSTNSSSSVNYCGANGRNTQYEWIETVEIGGMSFNSGNDGGFGDYTSNQINVDIGSTLDLAFTPGFGFFDYQENWQIWIDYNADGDFEDEGEAVFLISGNNRITGSIGIPNTATPGPTRIRIAMKWGQLIDPCESFSWGEVEDYTLVLNTAASIGSKPNNFDQTAVTLGPPTHFTTQIRSSTVDVNLFPNPSTDFIGLEWEDNASKTYNLLIYNSLGILQKQQKIITQRGSNKAKIAINQFPAGVYLLSLRNKDKILTKEFVVTK